MMAEDSVKHTVTFKHYPLSHTWVYYIITIIHFLLGGMGIIYGYGFSWAGKLVGYSYLTFTFIQMFIIMPVVVCPGCEYYKRKQTRCISGLNIFAKRAWNRPSKKDLSVRDEGFFCHNHFIAVSLLLPVIFIIHALILNFSLFLLLCLLIIVSLLLFRILIILPKMACQNCISKAECPNSGTIGFF
jgi:hypothetical protein